MSMLITNTTQFAAPPVPASVAQAAPALAGTEVAAAFADWMGLDASAAPAESAESGAVSAQADGEAGDTGAQAPVVEPQAATEQQELSSLQAMMMTMPAALSMPVQVTVQAAQAAVDGDTTPSGAPAAPAATFGPVSAAPAAQQGPAAAPAVQQSPVAAPAVQQSPAAAAPAAQSAASQPQQTAQPAPAFAAALSQVSAPAAPAPVASAADAPAVADVTVSATGAAAPATATVAAATTELKLAAAKPADWQQPLREALGDRLQLQLSKNIDQAVIRLDPPNLGRVEIAIRHMAGTLEVNISATHSEVVRQLHTISDTMRTDLASRHLSQFSQVTEVAVNVTAAPRAAAGQQQAFDQQGRQRQQERAAEDNGPGRGLAEAGNPSSIFSLNARESYT